MDTSQPLIPILDRIRKLLALSQSNNPNEAATALAMVTALCQKHNLDLAGLDLSEPADPIAQTAFQLKTQLKQAWLSWLAGVVAESNFCRILLSNKYTLIFVGRQREAEIAAFLFSSIYYRLMTLANTATRKYAKEKRVPKSSRRSQMHAYRQSWLEGATVAITTRLREQNAAFAEHRHGNLTGRELSLNRLAEIDGYLKGLNIGQTEINNRPRRNSAALAAGYQAGQQFEFQQGVGGAGAVAALPKPGQAK